ncbi:MAG: aminoglycoside phosphotransferase family protein [Streptomycetaceae bacterium]|nr:aminoglycoside phosphotransferase family protein [Streptomycetaceae bacterium]
MTPPAPNTDPAARAAALCPGLKVTGVLHRTGKTVLLTGTLDDRAVVVKALTDPDPFWREKFTREIVAYQAFATSPPPFPVPALRAADEAVGVFVLDHADGRPAATERYPPALPLPLVERLLAAVAPVRRWTPPPVLAQPVFAYPDRLARYRAAGLFDDADVAALTVLLRRTVGRWEFAHGDALLSNILITDDGRATLIDWEFAGLYPPAYDLALLWVLLRATEGARDRIETAAGDEPAVRAGFWISVATVLTREMRTHRELPEHAPQRAHLAGLTADWDSVRPLLGGLADERSH